MGELSSRLATELVKLARTTLRPEIEARDWNYDVAEVRLLKTLPYDLDRDGRDEICFVAGIPEYGGPALCGLLVESADGGYEAVALIPFEAGYRDLRIDDVNKDGLPEILVLWQSDFGLYLSVSVLQWDGSSARSLFPNVRFHQGLLETKDLDADGLDEMVVWSGVYETDPRWGPQRFDIHVFQYNGREYELQYTRRTQRRYLPTGILGQRVNMFGLPEQFERLPSPAEYRQKLEELKRSGGVKPGFADELGGYHDFLRREGFYQESLEIIDLELEAARHVRDSVERQRLLFMGHRAKASTLGWIGRWRESIGCYRRAISLYSGEVARLLKPVFGPSLHRELGMMLWRTGDYSKALNHFTSAQDLLEGMDLSASAIRDESSRLHSNLGLLYAQMAQFDLAEESFRGAIEIDEDLHRIDGLAINYTGLANVRRASGDYEGAVRLYERALEALDERSERDREADVYLELGLTLLLAGRPQEALSFVQLALLITTVPNIRHHAADHYVYAGEAYRQSGDDAALAERFLGRALDLSEEFGTPETRWQALYRLALMLKDQGHLERCGETLRLCIDTIEQLHSQYLPEPLKVTLLTGKDEPYRSMVRLLESQARASFSATAASLKKEEAFEYVERAKARVFVEQLAATTIGGEGIPDELLEKENKLIADLKILQLQHRAEVAEQRYDWGEEITEIEQRLRAVWAEMRALGPKGSEHVALREAAPASYASVRNVLGNRP